MTKAEAYDIAHGLIAMLYWAIYFVDTDVKEVAKNEVREYLTFCKEACKINRATNSELFVYDFLAGSLRNIIYLSIHYLSI
jgi:DNA-directed RNA polymerase subunit L